MTDVTTSPNIALFDLDGTLADVTKALRAALLELHGPDEPPLPENIWRGKTQPHIKARMELIKCRPGWWRDLPELPLGFQLLRFVQALGFEVHILTNGPRKHPQAWMEKVEWVEAHAPSVDGITVTRDKGLVYGKVLVDDYPDYMLRWLKHRPRGLGIMPLAEDNADFEHPNVVLCDGNNMDEVANRLKAQIARGS